MNTPWDFIIVGSGAGGSAAAYRLARAGRRVLLLERGPRLPRDGSTLDTRAVLAEGRFKAREEWRDGSGKTFEPEEFYNLGGKTQWYGAALLRFGADEFAADETRRFRAWPLSAEELAPYYAQAEALLDVRVFQTEPGLARIARRLDKSWHLQPLPLGLSAEVLELPEQATKFDGFALPHGLKADAEHRLLDRVAHLPNLSIETGAQVVALLPAGGHKHAIPVTESNHRVRGVLLSDGRIFEADRILLAAGALHSPRLLQKYIAEQRLETALPAAAQIGRHYKRHVLTAVLGFSLRRQTDLLRKTALFLNPRFPHSSVQPLGGWIDREIVSSTIPRFVPRFLRRFIAERVYGFFLQTEEGSHADNRVVADPACTPVLNYDPARLPHAESEHRGLVRSFVLSLLRAGYLAVARRIPLAGSAHSVGTMIAGDDPRTSVVDGKGKVHGMENLYIVDGSVLPRIGRFNPALSIYAWSLRVTDLLLQECVARFDEVEPGRLTTPVPTDAETIEELTP